MWAYSNNQKFNFKKKKQESVYSKQVINLLKNVVKCIS